MRKLAEFNISNPDNITLSHEPKKPNTINVTNNHESMNRAYERRIEHSCAILDDSQMFVLGGTNICISAYLNADSGCDTLYSPVTLLDTSTYSWKTEYKPNNLYSVPSAIYTVIGGK